MKPLLLKKPRRNTKPGFLGTSHRLALVVAVLAAYVWVAAAAEPPKTDATKAKDDAKTSAASKAKDDGKPATAAKAKDDAKKSEPAKSKDSPKKSEPPKKDEGKAVAAKTKEPAKQPAAPEPPLPKGPVPGDSTDFVYLGESRPLLVRLHVQIDGKSMVAAWEDSIKEIFKYLDRNGDGVLSKEEAEKTPPAQVLLNPNALYGGISAPSMSQLDTNKDGKVTLQELTEYYRRSNGGPFHFQTGQNQANVYYDVYGMQQNVGNMSDQLNDAIFALLDTNKDGKLSREELAAAPDKLLTVDADEDEMVTMEELLPNLVQAGRRRVFVRPPRRQTTATNSDFVMLGAGDTPAKLTRQLLSRYGSKSGTASAESLTRKQIGLEQAAFDELDLDKNGVLDAKELDRFARRAPDLELLIRHGRGRSSGPLEVLSPKGKQGLGSSMKADRGGYLLDLGNTRLELRGGGNSGGRASPANLRSTYVMQFKNLDTKKKGYLEQKDVRTSPFFANSFKMMDLDNDGKLTEKEVVEFITRITALQNKAMASCASLTVSDEGRGIFDLIDTSKDGRLSVREMRNAYKLIDQLDRDHDGQISRSEIPRSYLLVFSEGATPNTQNFGRVRAIQFGGQNQRRPTLSAGPLWFRKMDSNRDGDVSRKEFLGTDEEFARIDTDGDGLISLQEAEAFDKQVRAQKVTVTKSK
jgi:Ca2+-binding EF-hand superfamily protein